MIPAVHATPAPTSLSPADERVGKVLKHFWGYSTLRPLQAEAIAAGLTKRDSLVVMPTGGGKSLCYQIPPVVAQRTDVVISPLISLMKDQVDGLRACGYPAAAFHSGLSAAERREVEQHIASGECRLIFVAPERLVSPWFLNMAQRLDVRSFAIDEAHCISEWGHDFRPEYRQLAILKDRFPDASVHAFTATATPRVRQDIVAQLHLRDPAVLVGRFDRPNLIYRVQPAVDVRAQALEVVRRMAGEAVIIYCISRNDTESLAAHLKAHGVKAAHYHAGMEAGLRRKTQEAFALEQLDVIVATVAFGMGIDRSNVRCVIHASMPKSIEGYQQETGRAGRDGLEAQCVMFYSLSDAIRWESLIQRSAANTDDPEAVAAPAIALLKQVQRFCSVPMCRHRMLSEYFGQEYEPSNCGACDFCLGEIEGVADASETAQKVLSCIARTGQRFGVGHIVDVLKGADTAQVASFGHEKLSTFGILRDLPRKQLQNMVYQLIDLGFVQRTDGERPALRLNDESLAVMRGHRPVRLIRPPEAKAKRTKVDDQNWAGVDRDLFEVLRQWRKMAAQTMGVPAYVILGDAPLRELARVRPTNRQTMRTIKGIGDRKIETFGDMLLDVLVPFARERGLAMNVGVKSSDAPTGEDDIVDLDGIAPSVPETPTRRSRKARSDKASSAKSPTARATAMAMFAKGQSIDEVMAATGLARSTLAGYLEEHILETKPTTIARWVDDATYRQVEQAAIDTGADRLRPIFEHLEGRVSYDAIRLTCAHLRAMSEE